MPQLQIKQEFVTQASVTGVNVQNVLQKTCMLAVEPLLSMAAAHMFAANSDQEIPEQLKLDMAG